MNKHREDTVRHIEHELKHHPQNIDHVFNELNRLRNEDPRHFRGAVKEIDERLHKDGFLPHLHLVDEGKSLLMAEDSPNPKHHAVVSRSGHAPRESRQERDAYQKMGYDGWKDSAEGGGGANGGYDARAAKGQVPQGHKKELIDKALQLAGVQVTPQNEAAVDKIIKHESGWNPNAINLTDSNARAGHPSQGLMQTIPSTFRAYAVKGFDRNIHDPLSNIAAGVNYAVHRYGSLQNVPGIRAIAHGGHYRGY